MSQETADRLAAARTVIVGAADTNGLLRAKRLPGSRFEDGAPTVAFSDGMWAMDLHDALQPPPPGFCHWFPSWERGYGDTFGVPDLTTARTVPWLRDTMLTLCDHVFADGSPVRIAPRAVLRRVLERFATLGVEPRIATEFEFALLRETEESVVEKGYRGLRPLSAHAQGYGGTRATADGDVVDLLRDHLDAFGLPIEAWNPEGGPGQYELNVPATDPLRAADEGFLFKQAVKEVVQQAGLLATFIPKIGAEGYGNGLHLHQSLAGASFDPDSADGITPIFRQFIAGQLATLREFAILLLPTVNDYKRVTPDSGAGTSVSWGLDNKTVSLRLLPHGAAKCRVEHRVAGASANVYLVVAALLAGGAHGIEQRLEPPPICRGNAYLDPTIPTLPRSLEEAADLFEASTVARDCFGADFVAYYAATRRWEASRFATAVTDWELERYLVRT